MSSNTPTTEAEVQALMTKATKKELDKDYSMAFQLYIQGAQSYLGLCATSKDEGQKTKWKSIASKALDRADKLKKAHPNLTSLPKDPFAAAEQTRIAQTSSKVNGMSYSHWSNPTMEDFKVKRDIQQPTIGLMDTWINLEEDKACLIDLQMLPTELVQTMITNCSVVASIIVCWNHHLQHNSKLMISHLYPQTDDQIPISSPSGQYCYKMLINGIFRCINIDDLLPLHDEEPMWVSATQTNALWPALIEKAYMRMNGGYDFAGSDSGVDLRALIGWIPDHQSFQSTEFERERTWDILVKAFTQGNVLVTLGTSQSNSRIPGFPKLLPLHAYACIDFKDDQDRLVTIVNPWGSDATANGGEECGSEEQRDSPTVGSHASSDSYWKMSWDDICVAFHGAYLSWNPGLFKYKITHHRIWNPTKGMQDVYSPHLNHRIRIQFSEDVGNSEVWVLLSRHITDRNDSVIYIALHAFEEDVRGLSFVKPENLTVQGVYQENPHCLVKLKPDSQTKKISLIPSMYIPANTEPRGVGYTLTVWANCVVQFDTSSPPAMTKKTANIEFKPAISGGNLRNSSFFKNPQWKLKISQASASPAPSPSPNLASLRDRGVRTVFRAFAEKELSLNIKVFKIAADIDRLADLSDGQVVFDSGTYNFGLAFGESNLTAGHYIIILSTFSPGQCGQAAIEVSSIGQLDLTKIPTTGAGMHHRQVEGGWAGESAAGGPSFKQYWRNPKYEIRLDRTSELMFQMQTKPGTVCVPANIALFELSSPQNGGKGRRSTKEPETRSRSSQISNDAVASGNSRDIQLAESRERGDGRVETTIEEEKIEVATSGPYRESLYGVRISRKRLPAGNYLLVASTHSPGLKGSFTISIWSETPITIQSC